MFSLAGWLFADLLLALTIVFLASSASWVPQAGAKPSPPVICGLDGKHPQDFVLTVSDPNGLRASPPSRGTANRLANDLKHSQLKKNANRMAGFVEIFGGSPDVGDGTTFASGAIYALKHWPPAHFLFSSSTVFFKALWDGGINWNQLHIYVFYFLVAQSCNTSQ
jgi:hypothetical protein